MICFVFVTTSRPFPTDLFQDVGSSANLPVGALVAAEMMVKSKSGLFVSKCLMLLAANHARDVCASKQGAAPL